MGAVALDHLPEPDRLEVAFAGRSNVGKSSLINALTNQKGLARASGEPGRTRELNFFNVEGGDLRIVDLPGYGYAKAPKPVVEKWTRLTKAFLRGRVNLKRVYLLIDSRHGLKDVDLKIMDVFDEAAVSYQVVLTKTDKIKPPAVKRLIGETGEKIARRPAAFPRVIATSSAKQDGVDQLRAEIVALLPDMG
ncbi:ribosome biogenesis GTP-binding protein YihA/YsxC [Maricaulis maris]|jgi:GTP-binding protein|uniref:Probable GTP-binding protein EngB n=1 Tax=Maricaulis maris (strain MCS10) TaxID=394221 RepID=ENGB_MARMM|nr:ribosome biogenesis GTP-binding protein YihA/YsxC [Maricaulis maris]Q0ASI7.1 RecName: Full=Probable GTP-binding protein EngB [Maricaulis maris MCS10]ABI64750.1 GTP-binding protein [Maricaulis maris MCS10]